MSYNLELFDRIINGDLLPFIVNPQFPINYHETVLQKHKIIYTLTTATLKYNAKAQLEVISKSTFCALHPLAIKTAIPEPTLFEYFENKPFPNDVYKLLKIKKENAVLSLYYKKSKTIIVCIKEKCNIKTLPLNEVKYYYYNDILKDEVKRLKLEIKEKVFQFNSEKESEHYIHTIQHAIVSLCYQLHKVLQPQQRDHIYKPALQYTNSDILKLTYISLEGLLRFIEKNYLQFIDVNIQVPFRSSLVEKHNIQQKLEIVKSGLLNNNALNPDLLKIIYVPLLKLTAIQVEEVITYKQLIYLNQYLCYFHEYFTVNASIDENKIYNIIIDSNYNSIEAANFKIELIQVEALKLKVIQEQIDFLYRTLKTINQQPQSSQLAYNSALPSLKNQLTTWLEEEINYLNKSLKLAQPTTVNLFNQEQFDKIKIQSGFSVAQLACFHKLQYEVGTITNKNQRDISRFIADNYQTSKAFDISEESVNNKYYNIEHSTLQAVKDVIIKMLNQINKTKLMIWSFILDNPLLEIIVDYMQDESLYEII